MTKKSFYLILVLSFFFHLALISFFPLTADELNVTNIFMFHSNDFQDFWKYFIQYDTHQPLFHVMWFPFFKSSLSVFELRLPSFLVFVASVCLWLKLFPCKDEVNRVPWILFLFCPFLVIYSGLFLPYSLLIFLSLLNFYFFNQIENKLTLKNIIGFLISSVLLLLCHYYGALQALMLGVYLLYRSKNLKFKFIFAIILASLFILLLVYSDFLNDFTVVHSYRKIPGLFNVAGYINLLLGGLTTTLILIFLIFKKKQFYKFKTKEFIFIVSVLVIALMKSILISPSLEARYLLILIYPLYYLLKDLQVKFITPVLICSCLISFYFLEKRFSTSFVVNYSKITKNNLTTALVITPCPKYYFQEENYICIDDPSDSERFLRAFDMAIVHDAHIAKFKRVLPQVNCENLENGLHKCTMPAFHF